VNKATERTGADDSAGVKQEHARPRLVEWQLHSGEATWRKVDGASAPNRDLLQVEGEAGPVEWEGVGERHKVDELGNKV